MSETTSKHGENASLTELTHEEVVDFLNTLVPGTIFEVDCLDEPLRVYKNNDYLGDVEVEARRHVSGGRANIGVVDGRAFVPYCQLDSFEEQQPKLNEICEIEITDQGDAS